MLTFHEVTRDRPTPSEPPTTAPPLHTFLPDADGTMDGEVRPLTEAPPAWPWVALVLLGAAFLVAAAAPRAEPAPTELPEASVEESLAVFEAALAGELPPEDRRVLELAYADLQVFAAGP